MSTHRTIGLVGGMSWHSTLTYYRRINEIVAERLGGHHSARVTLQSLDFADVRAHQLTGDYEASGRLLAEAGRRCVAGGAELIAICTNLMHKNHQHLAAAVDVPVVHIADAVAERCRRHGWATVGLLGTRPVMEESFYAERLASHGIGVVTPSGPDRAEVDRIIFDELTRGIFTDASRHRYLEIIAGLAGHGAEAVAFACTEIGLLVPSSTSPLPSIDTGLAHAELLAELALAPVPVPAGC
ncbi:aspartate/glutamate racemase family protein [Nocardioides acrostichi]|uniref:Amino acid racemase n=1 Tax=Nocardioides acrostichi TaxID=2784339 RepID=A0A930Y5J2_9ACTN|nr:amino acid racemase [Nocardioides acrostichi]MBF4161300.1 amino acid racemase [Nocardioides acrostichi]